MTSALCHLTTDDARRLAAALRSGRLAPPFAPIAVRRFVAEHAADGVAAELQRRAASGSSEALLADLLDLLAEDRSLRRSVDDAIDLVWTGPEADGIASRDTSVVVRELFQNARASVLIAGYAVYRGHLVFKTLADRMDELPGLRARMFLDVRRAAGDTSGDAEVVWRFASHFRAHDWSGQRLPEVFYDPRSLEHDPARRASLHAKCVIVDGEIAFVSSANFTEAAHLRNIEVGTLVRSPAFARHLSLHFEALAAAGALRRVPFG